MMASPRGKNHSVLVALNISYVLIECLFILFSGPPKPEVSSGGIATHKKLTLTRMPRG